MGATLKEPTRQINIRIAAKWRERIQELADAAGVPASEYARHILLRHLQRGERRVNPQQTEPEGAQPHPLTDPLRQTGERGS